MYQFLLVALSIIISWSPVNCANNGITLIKENKSMKSQDMELIKLYLEEFRLEILSMKSQLTRMSRNSKLVRTTLKELKSAKCIGKELEYSNVDCPFGFELSTPSSCYKLIPERVTWLEAAARCKTMKSHLVSLESDSEQKLISNHLTNSRKLQNCDLWTSATDVVDEGVWLWNQTGHVIKTAHWHTGEPNNSNERENCAWLDWYFNWSWNDASCDRDKACFICEVDV